MNVLRHFGVNPRQNNSNNTTHAPPQQPQADEFDGLPALEPIPVPSNQQDIANTGAGPPPVSVVAEEPDVDMPPAIDPAFASFEQPARNEDESSMPALQSVSDSSTSDNSVDEVEMMPDLRPIDDDNDSNWTSDDENADDDLPPLEPIAGNRRARVDDDDDDDRDRRHPSQRTNNRTQQGAPNQRQGNPPFFAGINPPRGAQPPGMIDLFQTFMGGAGPPAGANANNARANRNNENPGPGQPRHPNRPAFPMPPIQFTVEIGDRRWNGQPDENGNFDPPPGFMDMMFPDMTEEERADPVAQFRVLLERLGGVMGQAFGIPFEEEKEDPERAKRLVDGLEVVPVGLVKRMEKVGGAPGGHVDDATGEVDVPGCAICWDKLLDAEGDGFKVEENADVNAHGEEAAATLASAADNAGSDGGDVTMDDQPSASTLHTSESLSDPPTPIISSDPSIPIVDSSSPKPPINEDANKIVCLPCAHVFHASCLIPWFSRPRQTTCPTCRFNIDPENLTYVPRPRQPQPAATGPMPPIPPAFFAAAPPPGDPPAPAADVPGGDPPAGDIPPNPPNAIPNVPPNAAPWAPPGAQGLPPGFGAMFGNAHNNPFQWVPFAVGGPEGGGGPNADFGAMFAGVFPMPMGGQPGAPTQGPPGQQQQQQQQQQQAPPPPFFVPNPGAPQPMPHPGLPPGARLDPNDPNAMFTVDFTLFTNTPFEGNGVRRQTHVFTNQTFGGEGPNDAPPGAGAPPPAQQQQQQQQQPPQQPPPFTFAAPFPHPGLHRTPQSQPREKKQWTPPPAPGATLRSRVEEREREVGLRCCDTSCGVGPSDEDPFPDVSGLSMKQVSIRPPANSLIMGTSVCSHTFHPACLVSAERVAGWGEEDKIEQREVEVSCPHCRAVGCVSREEWEEGVRGLA